LAIVKFFSQLHMLVDFEYLFLYKSFGLEIWHICYYHRDDLMEKFMVKYQFLNPQEGVIVGSSEISFPVHWKICKQSGPDLYNSKRDEIFAACSYLGWESQGKVAQSIQPILSIVFPIWRNLARELNSKKITIFDSLDLTNDEGQTEIFEMGTNWNSLNDLTCFAWPIFSSRMPRSYRG